MYEVGVVEQFEGAHRLSGNFGAATRTHGHTYRVELVVRGQHLRDDGTLCDIGQLGDALRAAIGELDHQNLDVLPVFSGRNTTAEIVAEHVLDRVTPAIDVHGLAGIMIRVWESPGAFAAFERMLTDR